MMDIFEFFNQNHNYSTEFSKDIKDYRLLNKPVSVDDYYNETYQEYYEEYKNKGLFVVTADRDIPFKMDYYWLGDLIIDKNNNILGGIAFN